jgi:hypothetical protein
LVDGGGAAAAAAVVGEGCRVEEHQVVRSGH